MSDALNSGTGAGLIEFLDWTIERSELNRSTASALKVGCNNVLSVEEDPGGIDLRTLDVDHFLQRFTTKAKGKYKDKSLDQYRQRFRQSVQMYLLWLDDKEWRPSRLRPTSNGNGNGGGNATRRSAPSAQQRTSPARAEPLNPPEPPPLDPGLIEYPFVIRPGLRVRLVLPEDLTSAEAERLAAHIKTLAFDSHTDDHS